MEKGVLATRVWKYGPHKNAGVRVCVCVCVCVFGAIAYTVASRKTKDMQGFEIRTPVLSFFTRIFHGYICLEVAPLTTKLTVIGT